MIDARWFFIFILITIICLFSFFWVNQVRDYKHRMSKLNELHAMWKDSEESMR